MNNFSSPNEVAEAYDGISIAKANRDTVRVLLLSILGGMFIAIAGFTAQMVSHSIENTGLAKFASGAVFPLGLILVVIAGAELFTGNTLIMIGYADKRITLRQLLRNWTLVYIGNFFGCSFIAFLVHQSGLLSTTGGLLGATAISAAVTKVSLPFNQILVRGILGNILVSLAVWMSASAKDISGKVMVMWFAVMAFVVSSFEHSIANMYYIMLGIFAKSNPVYLEAGKISEEAISRLNASGLMANLIPSTLGNIIGGAFVVALTYWYVYRYPLVDQNS